MTRRSGPRRRARGRHEQRQSHAIRPNQVAPKEAQESERDPSSDELDILKREHFAVLAGLLGIPLNTDADKQVAMIVGENTFAMLESGRAWRLFLNALPFGLRETYMPPNLTTKQIAVRKNLPVRQNARENLTRFASEIVTSSSSKQPSARQLAAANRLLPILCGLESKLSFIYDALCPETEETVKLADVLTAKIDEQEEIEDKVVEAEPGETTIHSRTGETTPELLRISEAATLGDVDRMTIDDWIRNPILGFAACVEVTNDEEGDKRIRRDEFLSFMEGRKERPRSPSGRDSASAMTATTEWVSPPESDQSLRAIAIRYYGRDKPFSMKELMTMFGCSRWTIRRWCQRGLKRFVNGRIRVFPVEEVYAFTNLHTL